MSENLLYGDGLAATMLEETVAEIQHEATLGNTVHFTTILVGDDPASRKYIDMKQREGSELGLSMSRIDLPETSSQEKLEDVVVELSDDPETHAVLVQYPLPAGLNYLAAISKLNPKKDVDGLHPYNLGLLLHDPEEYPGIVPCTPNGIVELLEDGGVELEGANVVVVGRGLTVGAPLSMLFSGKNNGTNATVTTVHKGTKELSNYLPTADVVIGATGVPGLIGPELSRDGATLVSVGVSYDEHGKARGDFTKEARDKAGVYVPVTRGIGPMTRANLWKNVLRCYRLQQNES